MSLPSFPSLKPTRELTSGQVYRVQLEHRCYRINEPDHFLQNLKIDFFGYLNEEGQFLHFNRLKAQEEARTSLQELLQIPAIRTVEFEEVSRDAQLWTQNQSWEAVESLGFRFALLKKLLETPKPKQAADETKTWKVEDLLLEVMSDYVESPDLPA